MSFTETRTNHNISISRRTRGGYKELIELKKKLNQERFNTRRPLQPIVEQLETELYDINKNQQDQLKLIQEGFNQSLLEEYNDVQADKAELEKIQEGLELTTTLNNTQKVLLETNLEINEVAIEQNKTTIDSYNLISNNIIDNASEAVNNPNA